jgi:hypothetical protein
VYVVRIYWRETLFQLLRKVTPAGLAEKQTGLAEKQTGDYSGPPEQAPPSTG